MLSILGFHRRLHPLVRPPRRSLLTVDQRSLVRPNSTPLANSSAIRRRIGIGLFLLGTFLPAFIPLIYVIGVDGWMAAVLTAAFSIGLPELFWILAAIFIGREGVRYLWRHVRLRIRRFIRCVRRHSASIP